MFIISGARENFVEWKMDSVLLFLSKKCFLYKIKGNVYAYDLFHLYGCLEDNT